VDVQGGECPTFPLILSIDFRLEKNIYHFIA